MILALDLMEIEVENSEVFNQDNCKMDGGKKSFWNCKYYSFTNKCKTMEMRLALLPIERIKSTKLLNLSRLNFKRSFHICESLRWN